MKLTETKIKKIIIESALSACGRVAMLQLQIDRIELVPRTLCVMSDS